MNYEKFSINGEDYKDCTAGEIFSLAFELGNICSMVNSGLRGDEIVFSSINKNNITGYCKFKGINFEIRDHDDFPILVLL